MSSYTSFAIVGFGQAGSLFVNEFLKLESTGGEKKYHLRVLTRNTGKPELKALAKKGVDVRAVDYTSHQSIVDALRGTDVVLSALRDDGLDLQLDIIRAAKDANVKLFVPSEYGRNTLGDTSEYLKVKAEAHDVLKELHLPYTLFFTGTWPEMLLPGGIGDIVGIDLEAGEFALFGDGTLPQSYTSPRSFIPFVVHLLTTLAPPQLENRVFEIEGDRKSFWDLITLWQTKHPTRRVRVTERSEAETQEFIDAQTNELFRFIPQVWSRGEMLVSGEANRLWPEWEPLTWEDLMP